MYKSSICRSRLVFYQYLCNRSTFFFLSFFSFLLLLFFFFQCRLLRVKPFCFALDLWRPEMVIGSWRNYYDSFLQLMPTLFMTLHTQNVDPNGSTHGPVQATFKRPFEKKHTQPKKKKKNQQISKSTIQKQKQKLLRHLCQDWSCRFLRICGLMTCVQNH